MHPWESWEIIFWLRWPPRAKWWMMCMIFLTIVYKKGISIDTTSRTFLQFWQKSKLARLTLPLSLRRTVPAPGARSKTCIQMIDSTENFYRVYLAITGMYALYVKPNSKEMISISLARCQEIFFFWKDRRGQGQVESTPLVFGIWCFWFGFSLVLV